MSKLKQVREKAQEYGYAAMTEGELLTLTKYMGNLDSYYISPEYYAANELKRRRQAKERVKITSSAQVADALSFLKAETEECFYVILLNRANHIIKIEFICKGTSTAVVVDIQKIARKAIEHKAQAVIVAHNHPSGNKTPSEHDKSMTKKIKEALLFFDINLIEHIIITPESGFFSFSDEGMV